MPIYEYRCQECGSEFDLLVMRRDEADNQKCPNCGAMGPTRKMSAFSSPGMGSSCGSCSTKSSSCAST